MQHGVSQESIYRNEPSKGLQEVVYEVASVAKVHLDKARSLSTTVPNEAKVALLSSVSFLTYQLYLTDYWLGKCWYNIGQTAKSTIQYIWSSPHTKARNTACKIIY